MSGRSAARDMSAMSSMRSVGMGPTVGMNSSVVPGWPRSAPARATNSSKVADRDGTGRAVAVEMALAQRGRESESAAGQRLLDQAHHGRRAARAWPAPGWRASPMTTRRTVECPTRNPALTASPTSMRVRYSAKDVQSHAPPLSERGDGDALDHGHHLLDVVGVIGPEGGDGEPAVPPRGRWSPREAPTDWPWCPTAAGRRSGCAGR